MGITWIAVTGVLLVILLANQLARVLSQAAAKGFPRDVVFSLIGLTTAGYMSVIVPIGFFLAIMLGLGRLYHESEMAAMQSCGVGPAGLYRPIGVLAVFIVAMLTWLSFFGIPQAAARAQEIRAEALRDAQFGSLEPGRFRTFGSGNIVFYAERVDENGVLYNVNVFVDRTGPDAKGPGAGNLEVWVAARAEQRGAGQAEQTFVLYDGERYEGVPGSGAFRKITFSEGGIPIRLGELAGGSSKPDMKLTSELLSSSKPTDIAEFHKRLASPLSAIVLMMLAVPLARLRPRQGRFGKIGIAILAYFIYSQVQVAARTWIETGVVPPAVGLWWVHALGACVGLWLLARENPPGRARPVAAGA